MARKYKAVRIYEPLIDELEVEAKAKGVPVSVLVQDKLKIQVYDIAAGDEYTIMGERVSGVNKVTVTNLGHERNT